MTYPANDPREPRRSWFHPVLVVIAFIAIAAAIATAIRYAQAH